MGGKGGACCCLTHVGECRGYVSECSVEVLTARTVINQLNDKASKMILKKLKKANELKFNKTNQHLKSIPLRPSTVA